jgi:hypothetical protein
MNAADERIQAPAPIPPPRWPHREERQEERQRGRRPLRPPPKPSGVTDDDAPIPDGHTPGGQLDEYARPH